MIPKKIMFQLVTICIYTTKQRNTDTPNQKKRKQKSRHKKNKSCNMTDQGNKTRRTWNCLYYIKCFVNVIRLLLTNYMFYLKVTRSKYDMKMKQ